MRSSWNTLPAVTIWFFEVLWLSHCTVPCGCSEHVGRTIINDMYSCDAETMFKLIFTDSGFMRNLILATSWPENSISKSIKRWHSSAYFTCIILCMYMSGLEIGEWHSQSDGTRLSDLSYTQAHRGYWSIYMTAQLPGHGHRVNHNSPW